MNNANHFIHRVPVSGQSPTISLEKARNGMWTGYTEAAGAPFYLHSRYDPANEAERFVSAQLKDGEDDKPERIVVYGIGCGHHVKALLKETQGSDVVVEVWESNVQAFVLMEHNGVFEELVNEPRVQIVVTDDLRVYSERMKGWQDNRVLVIVHEPSLRIVPEKLEPLMRALRSYQVQKNSTIVHRELMLDNFNRNNGKERPSVSAIMNIPSVPAILISAGPSLSKSLPVLPEAARYALLGSVGTAVPLLLKQGIRPDFAVMTDPQPKMLEQLKGWEEESIPLFFLSSVYSEVVERYRGPKFILYQEGFAPAEQEAAVRGEPLIRTGGSVSTTLFSLARAIGLEPLCLVGQDLAYTDNMTHAEGAPLFHRWEGASAGERVKAFDGQGTVTAPQNLLLYKKWFEEQARSEAGPFYNATEGGAYIEGFKHVTLAKFVETVRMSEVSEARECFRGLVRLSSMD